MTAGRRESDARCCVTSLVIHFHLHSWVIGFLIAAVTVHGRGLHDMIAGTIVVREGSI